MRKMSMLAAVAALFAVASTATAGDINLYFNLASTTGSTCPAYGTPGNPTLYLGTPSQDAAIAHSASYHTGSLHQYMKVNPRFSGPGDEMVSALGQDIVASAPVGGTASLTATAFTVFNTAADTTAAGVPWSGVNTPTVGAAPALVTNSRAVAVPSSNTDFGNWLNGYAPRVAPYHTAQMNLSSGNLGAGEGSTTYTLNMKVGSLKITRVYDPTAAGTPPTTAESVAFGYNSPPNNTPEDPAAPNGSTVGATSTTADATVIVRKKGDFGSVNQDTGDFDPNSPDGNVDSDDISYFYNNLGNTSPLFVYLGDFGQVNQDTGDFETNPDCVADSDDLSFMFNFALGS